MDAVIDLQRWRRDHAGAEEHDARLERAVERFDGIIEQRGWTEPPQWVITELLAVQGCLSLGMEEEAAWRVERLIQRAERAPAPKAAR